MKPGITSLTIEGFRALRKLTIEGLGRVNLITGRNNTGKSSVLETLRLLASHASLSVISGILRYREETVGEMEEPTWVSEVDSLSQLSSLFSGFPELTAKLQPISIRANGGPQALKLAIRVGLISREGGPGIPFRFVERKGKRLKGDELFPALIIESTGGKQTFPLEHLAAKANRNRLYWTQDWEEPHFSCFYVSPRGDEKTASLGVLWDNIALSDREKDVVDALRIIDSKISAVSMIGGDRQQQTRMAIVRSDNFERPVPLRSFGDGLNRLFGIVLSLVNAKDGFLLIDEFENGMHYTVQLATWRAIFRLAKSLDVQVFATSHSWDAIEAFQKAAAESPEDGVLVRLSRRDDKIIPTLFREDELAVATRDHIEVR